MPFIVALGDARNARLIARLRILYARALNEPLPEEWRGLAERIEAAQSHEPPSGRP